MLINRQILHSSLDGRYPIDRIKNLLRDAGAEKGDLVTISIMVVNDLHITSILACAEMGLKLILLDSPATIESLPYTKLALHGPSQFYIHDSLEDTSHVYGGLHDEMVRRYGGKPVDVRQDASNERFYVDVKSDDPFIMSSTSGTTKPSRPILFSHEEVYKISKRNVKIFGFNHWSKVCHTRNLHHAAAMLTSLFPSLMSTGNHISIPIGHDLSGDGYEILKGYKNIRIWDSTHIMIPNKTTLMDFLESIDKPFDFTLNINMCGFALDQSFVDLAQKYNIKFLSHYGSIDTAIPLLVNFVDKESTVLENTLGVLPDNFYKTTLENGHMKVEHEWWDEPRYMEDHLRKEGDEFIIRPRKENTGRYLTALTQGLDIDLELFFQDTKLNMEQLRGHIHEVKKSKKSA